jgi:hypothetical protein
MTQSFYYERVMCFVANWVNHLLSNTSNPEASG